MKKILFAILVYLNLLILAVLLVLFAINQISLVETLVIYFLFYGLIRLLMRWVRPLPDKGQGPSQPA